jgi:hypothetical protein
LEAHQSNGPWVRNIKENLKKTTHPTNQWHTNCWTYARAIKVLHSGEPSYLLVWRKKLLLSFMLVESRSHLPSKPGQLCALELFGPLPVDGRGVRYTLACLYTFTKCTRLYALCTATTRSCLNKINDYIRCYKARTCAVWPWNTIFITPVGKETWQTEHRCQVFPYKAPRVQPKCVIKERNKVLQYPL